MKYITKKFFMPFEREDVVKRAMEKNLSRSAANELLDAFCFLSKLIKHDAGQCGDDVIYYFRQDRAMKIIGRILGLTDKEMRYFYAPHSTDFYAKLLYTNEEERRYIDNMTEEDKRELEKYWNKSFESLTNYITHPNGKELRNSDKRLNHYDLNGNIIGSEFDFSYLNEDDSDKNNSSCSSEEFEKYTNPTDPHAFCKGLVIRNLKSRGENVNKRYIIIGLYKDTKVGSSNYGKYSFAVKEYGSTAHGTSFWFPSNDEINPNIVFENEEFDKYYRSEAFKKDLKNIKNRF